MEDFNIRRKSEYENLDKTYQSSNASDWRKASSKFGTRPTFCKSDSAISAPKSLESRNFESNNVNSKFARSIPCLFRLGTSRSLNTVAEHFPEKIRKSENENRFSLRHKGNIWFLGYICFYVMYLLGGSFCIELIETPIEMNLRKNYVALRESFLQKYPQISDDLEDFVKSVIAANDLGISILNDSQNATNWNFGQSLFFSTSLVTTIGYGHITPKSLQGKLFCVVFAAIGIPLTLVLFSAVVERLLTPSNYLLNVILKNRYFSHKVLSSRLIHLALVGFLVLVIFFVIPMIVLVHLENSWTFFDAFYFCFISLTTIGLGDFIPGGTGHSDYESLYKALFSLYMIIGLIGMMLLLTIFYDIPQLNLGFLLTQNQNHKPNTKAAVSSIPKINVQPENSPSIAP